jgi:hypothetical protein
LTTQPRLLGVDFTSAPSRRKAITCVWGRLDDANALTIEAADVCASFAGFEAQLQCPGPWLGAFDFPFGLPRELVLHLGWPQDWPGLIGHYASLPRNEIRTEFKAFCAARPVGAKFAHRACDIPAGSSPSMKWVNPPVAYMLHAGAPRLLAAGVTIPGLYQADPQRVALEGYPALLARNIIGSASYKSDDAARNTTDRRERRRLIVAALADGKHVLGVKVALPDSLAAAMIDESSADQLDALLCCVQAAWAARQPNYGLPRQFDPLEGWIVTAPHA